MKETFSAKKDFSGKVLFLEDDTSFLGGGCTKGIPPLVSFFLRGGYRWGEEKRLGAVVKTPL